MNETDEILKNNIREYVIARYGSFLEGKSLFYGKAIIPLDMLIDESAEVSKLNPEVDLHRVVDEMFDYFCS